MYDTFTSTDAVKDSKVITTDLTGWNGRQLKKRSFYLPKTTVYK